MDDHSFEGKPTFTLNTVWDSGPNDVWLASATDSVFHASGFTGAATELEPVITPLSSSGAHDDGRSASGAPPRPTCISRATATTSRSASSISSRATCSRRHPKPTAALDGPLGRRRDRPRRLGHFGRRPLDRGRRLRNGRQWKVGLTLPRQAQAQKVASSSGPMSTPARGRRCERSGAARRTTSGPSATSARSVTSRAPTRANGKWSRRRRGERSQRGVGLGHRRRLGRRRARARSSTTTVTGGPKRSRPSLPERGPISTAYGAAAR